MFIDFRFSFALNKKAKDFIRMPTQEECHQISQAFEHVSNLPMVIGCIDGTHIPIKPPKAGYRDFVNRKGWSSYNVQDVVDDKYRLVCVMN
jgi:hypothetical protein